MSILKRLFGRKNEKAAVAGSAADSIAPTHFRKEEFAFEAFQDLSALEAQQKVEQGNVQVLDVRFEYEYETHHIPGAKLIPLPQLPTRHHELDSSCPTLVVCEHGIRSLQACTFLSTKGFTKLFNLAGGMSAYPGKQEGSAK